ADTALLRARLGPAWRRGPPPPAPPPPAPPPTPAEPQDWKCTAVSVPSFFAPTLTVMNALGALPVQRCSWCRSRKSLTGAPAILASRHATTEKAPPVADGPSLLPKPPPM